MLLLSIDDVSRIYWISFLCLFFLVCLISECLTQLNVHVKAIQIEVLACANIEYCWNRIEIIIVTIENNMIFSTTLFISTARSRLKLFVCLWVMHGHVYYYKKQQCDWDSYNDDNNAHLLLSSPCSHLITKEIEYCNATSTPQNVIFITFKSILLL